LKTSETGALNDFRELHDCAACPVHFFAGLTAFAQTVIDNQPDDYKAQVEASQQAGKPIVERDRLALDSALIEMAAQVAQQAEAQVQAQAEAKPKAKAREKELVTA
jgi:formate dehydrogenase maturation protein FdhE